MKIGWLKISTAGFFLLCIGCNSFFGGQNETLLELKPCRVSKIENEVKCASLEVPEDRSTKSGRKISINIVVLPALSRNKLPDPIFIFAGGPGQAATELASFALAMAGELNNERDIVLVDQRGTGKSNGLTCDVPNFLSDQWRNIDSREKASINALLECKQKLEKKANLKLYTTTIAVADIDAVRSALGYQQINLYGGSYGTRSAMEYLRRYEAHVRSVVIDGVAPPSMKISENFSRDAGKVLKKMYEECTSDPACRALHPQQTLAELVRSLKNNPEHVWIESSISGIKYDLDIDHESILNAIFPILYSPESVSLLPSLLNEAKNKNFSPLFTIADQFSDPQVNKIAMGMQLSVVCAEDIPRINEHDRGPQPFPFGNLLLNGFTKNCKYWPQGKMAEGFDKPVESDKPVLILSGGADPVTPAINGQKVADSLPNSGHVIAPNIGHGVSLKGCAPKLIRSFIKNASAQGLELGCLEQIPSPLFFEPLKDRLTNMEGDGEEPS